MYGCSFTKKSDTRRLLLDYTSFDNPLKKDYACVGYSDCFYDFFNDNLSMIPVQVIDL